MPFLNFAQKYSYFEPEITNTEEIVLIEVFMFSERDLR